MLFRIWIPGLAWAYGGKVLVESGFPAVDRKVHHFRRRMCYGSRLLNQPAANSARKRKHNRPMPGMWTHHRNNGHHQRAIMDSGTSCTSSTTMPLWVCSRLRLWVRRPYTRPPGACVNRIKSTHPTADRKSAAPTLTSPGPSDTAGQDAHNPSTTSPNLPIPPPKKHTFCHLSRHAEKSTHFVA